MRLYPNEFYFKRGYNAQNQSSVNSLDSLAQIPQIYFKHFTCGDENTTL